MAEIQFIPTRSPTRGTDLTPMDPRLQRLIALRQRGLSKPATSSTRKDEVAVIAKVSDLEAWQSLSEVTMGAVIGGRGDDGSWVVTGRIPVSRIEFVRTQPFVHSLKAAQRLSRELASTTEEILARPNLLPGGNKARGGRGVVVGIVDIGCDFAHQNFRTTSGRTRIRRLWDQHGDTNSPPGFNYGTLYTSTAINAALQAANPYQALGYGPDPFEAAHGTHVMDIAAGNGRGSGVPGVAPGAELIFVEIASSDIPWQGSEVVGKNFGDSVQLLEALAFIFQAAGAKPCVVNVSLGTNGGPHDGSTLVEQGIDRLLEQTPDRAVVIAASNSYADGIHAEGTVPKGGRHDLPWVVGEGDITQNELELWYPGEGRLSVEILQPDGTSLGKVGPNESGTVSSDGEVVLFVANRLHDPNNGDNMIGVFLNTKAPTGRWTLRLKDEAGRSTPFHAWVERDDAGQSSFPPPHDGTHTIGSISCGRHTLVVGSYDAHKPALPLSWFSSAGPTRDGRPKPEVSAPGHDVVAARSRSKTGTTRMSGTSMAAPAVTGAVALLLAEAKARKKSLDVGQIRQAVIETARRNPPQGGGWHDRYGNGRVSAKGLVAAAMSATPIAAAPEPEATPARSARRTPRPRAAKEGR